MTQMAGTSSQHEQRSLFRPRLAMWTFNIIFWPLIILFLLAWWLLPVWQPLFVVRYSPWIGPAFRAAVEIDEKTEFINRKDDFGDAFYTCICDALQSESEKVRKYANQYIESDIRDPRIVPGLLPRLKETNANTLYGNLLLLTKYDAPSIYQPIIDNLPRIYDDYSKGEIFYLMGQHENPQYYSFIEKLFVKPISPREITFKAMALHRKNDKETLGILRQGIGVIYNQFNIDIINKALLDTRIDGLDDMIAELLESPYAKERLCGMDVAFYKRDNRYIASLIKLLSDPIPDLRTRVIRNASLYNDEQIRNALKAIAINETENEIAVAAIRSFRNRPEWCTDLLLFMELPQPERRLAAIQSIRHESKFTSEQIRQIRLLLKDKDYRVGYACHSIDYILNHIDKELNSKP